MAPVAIHGILDRIIFWNSLCRGVRYIRYDVELTSHAKEILQHNVGSKDRTPDLKGQGGLN